MTGHNLGTHALFLKQVLYMQQFIMVPGGGLELIPSHCNQQVTENTQDKIAQTDSKDILRAQFGHTGNMTVLPNCLMGWYFGIPLNLNFLQPFRHSWLHSLKT